MKRSRSTKVLPNTALAYVLESLIPYSDANIKLAFKPHLFFNDLENIARQKQEYNSDPRALVAGDRQVGRLFLVSVFL